MTERATRIFNTAQSCYALLLLVFASLEFFLLQKHAIQAFWLSQIVLMQLQPLILVLVKVLLDPEEQAIQSGFAEEARTVVQRVKPM